MKPVDKNRTAPSTDFDPFTSPMTRQVNRNLLKYAAGTAMFCPCCDHILDAPKTVLISAGAVTKTVCAACWDATIKPSIVARGILEKCDVVDGREVFKRAR